MFSGNMGFLYAQLFNFKILKCEPLDSDSNFGFCNKF